jgi:hypothetical protein
MLSPVAPLTDKQQTNGIYQMAEEKQAEQELETTEFNSSAIAGANYNKSTQELTVEFNSGRSYSFTGVPQSLWESFKNSKSAGSFYNANIRGIY